MLVTLRLRTVYPFMLRRCRPTGKTLNGWTTADAWDER